MTQQEMHELRQAQLQVNPPVTWTDWARGPKGAGQFIWWKLQSIFEIERLSGENV